MAPHFVLFRVAAGYGLFKITVLRTDVESEVIYRFGKDGWKQIPDKIMIG